MWMISAVSLGLLLVLCIAAPFVPAYYDNPAQRWGFFFIFLGTFARWLGIIESHSLQPPWPIVGEASVFAHVGTALYALGTAWKVWRHSRTWPPNGPGASRWWHHAIGWRKG